MAQLALWRERDGPPRGSIRWINPQQAGLPPQVRRAFADLKRQYPESWEVVRQAQRDRPALTPESRDNRRGSQFVDDFNLFYITLDRNRDGIADILLMPRKEGACYRSCSVFVMQLRRGRWQSVCEYASSANIIVEADEGIFPLRAPLCGWQAFSDDTFDIVGRLWTREVLWATRRGRLTCLDPPS